MLLPSFFTSFFSSSSSLFRLPLARKGASSLLHSRERAGGGSGMCPRRWAECDGLEDIRLREGGHFRFQYCWMKGTGSC